MIQFVPLDVSRGRTQLELNIENLLSLNTGKFGKPSTNQKTEVGSIQADGVFPSGKTLQSLVKET